jgi:GT2 family glycosyltransferase
MLLRVEAVRRVGLLDESYFLYYEELDYAHRLRGAGYTLSWCPQSRVRHHGTGSPSRPRAASQQYHEQLSALRYTRRHHPGWLPLVLLLRVIGKPLAMCIKGQVRLVPAGLRAVRDFIWPRLGMHPEF